MWKTVSSLDRRAAVQVRVEPKGGNQESYTLSRRGHEVPDLCRNGECAAGAAVPRHGLQVASLSRYGTPRHGGLLPAPGGGGADPHIILYNHVLLLINSNVML